MFSPLASPAFRAIWLASLAANHGSFMMGVAIAWVMTSLTTVPTIVALIPVAFSLPSLLVTLPSGVCADVLGRRRVLAFTALWSTAVCLGIALWLTLGSLNPWGLLMLLFALGMGNSARIPAWQATVQDVVPREKIAQAISLNSIAFNVARTIGPALGGLLVAFLGAVWVIVLNALSAFSMFIAVKQLNYPPPRARPHVRELLTTLKEGAQALMDSSVLLRILSQSVMLNSLFASFWAFLPLVGRTQLGLEAWEFGVLMSSVGIGGILGAISVPLLIQRMRLNTVLTLFTCGCSLSLLGIALADSFAWALCFTFIGGVSIVGNNINLNVRFQQHLPEHLRSRLLSFYFLAFELSLVCGAAAGGSLAGIYGTTVVLLLLAGLLGVVAVGRVIWGRS